MRFLVTAEYTSGEQPPLEMRFDTEKEAREHADWLFNAPGYHTVQMQEQLGVLLTYADGTKAFEQVAVHEVAVEDGPFRRVDPLEVAREVADSWSRVAANYRVNRTKVRKAEVVGVRYITSRATPEDIALGAWHAAALGDPKVCPSMKYDINRWMDSKEWP